MGKAAKIGAVGGGCGWQGIGRSCPNGAGLQYGDEFELLARKNVDVGLDNDLNNVIQRLPVELAGGGFNIGPVYGLPQPQQPVLMQLCQRGGQGIAIVLG